MRFALEQDVRREWKERKSIDLGELRVEVATRLAEMRTNEPALVEAYMDLTEDNYHPPSAKKVDRRAELRAAMAQPPVVKLTRRLTASPYPLPQLDLHGNVVPKSAPRNHTADLSGAVATISYLAFMDEMTDVKPVYQRLTGGNRADLCAVNFPVMPNTPDTTYDHIHTVVGWQKDRKPGHNPTFYVGSNVGLLKRILKVKKADGSPLYPDVCKRALTDGSRMRSGAKQKWVKRDEDIPGIDSIDDDSDEPPLELLDLYERYAKIVFSGREIDMVGPSYYGHKLVIGWHLVVLVDQQTGLPIVWTMVPFSKWSERMAIKLILLPMLIRLWGKGCPLEEIVMDGHGDNAEFIHELGTKWLVHVIARRKRGKKNKVVVEANHGKAVITAVNGQAQCFCQGEPAPMGFLQHSDVKTPADAEAAGYERGKIPLDFTLDTRTRWKCEHCKRECSTWWYKRQPYVYSEGVPKRESLHESRRAGRKGTSVADEFGLYLHCPAISAGKKKKKGDSSDVTDYHWQRRALLLRQNGVELSHSLMKRRGIGGDRAILWAKDGGIQHLVGMHFVLRTALCLAHLNGDYERALREMEDLGLFSSGRLGSIDEMKDQCRGRASPAPWEWPEPVRLPNPDALEDEEDVYAAVDGGTHEQLELDLYVLGPKVPRGQLELLAA
jgi:hypothetical protein